MIHFQLTKGSLQHGVVPRGRKAAFTLLTLTLGMSLTSAQQTTQSSPAKQAARAISKMTNADVIQLVTAGLSEQVVTTSIRQAPGKNFDLTPTGLIALKKAGVSDAVIVVMQEAATPVQAAAASEAKTPPKYDASLSAPPKPAAHAAQPSDGRGVVEKALVEVTGTFSVPIGQTRLSGNDLAQVKQLEASGLVAVREVPQAYWDSFLNRTQGLGTPVQVTETSKLMSLQPAVMPVAGTTLRIFRVSIANITIDEVTADGDYVGPLATPGEKYRIMLGTYRKVPIPAAAIFGPSLATQTEVRMKFRSVVKYDQFAKIWALVAFDTGFLNTNEWLSSNVR